MPAKLTTVAQYIAAAPKTVQARLREMRECVLAAAPDAVEGLKWGMPSVSYRRVIRRQHLRRLVPGSTQRRSKPSIPDRKQRSVPFTTS
ncbi:MAG: DUF1801 domain-containing protein [Gemmatimonadales bacterium]